jgi:hypothetical protein
VFLSVESLFLFLHLEFLIYLAFFPLEPFQSLGLLLLARDDLVLVLKAEGLALKWTPVHLILRAALESLVVYHLAVRRVLGQPSRVFLLFLRCLLLSFTLRVEASVLVQVVLVLLYALVSPLVRRATEDLAMSRHLVLYSNGVL